MVRVQLCHPVNTDEGLEVVADLTVDGRDVQRLEGRLAHLIDLNMPVMGVSESRIVTFLDNPEEWARSLIGAFRAPDLFARVVADDHPVEDLDDALEEIRVPAGAAGHR